VGSDEGLDPAACAKNLPRGFNTISRAFVGARRNQGHLRLSPPKVLQAFPSPVSETVGETTSTALIALQQALAREPKQIGIKGVSLWGRMKFQTDLIGCDKSARALENS
jgi:hypothetical protein